MAESRKTQTGCPKSDSDVFTRPFIPAILFGYCFRKVLSEFSLGVVELLFEGAAIS